MLGVICADGCLAEHANGYHCLNITSKDLGWLEQIRQTLRAGHKIGQKRRAYQLQIRHQGIYNCLLGYGLTPRKSKTLQLPPVPEEVFSDFVRGYFDGDGCVTIWQETRWRHTWQMKTTFTSGSKKFLEALRARLSAEARMTSGSMWFGRAYNLRYTIADSMKLCRFMYPAAANYLCLARKRERFQAFQLRRTLQP